jgi:hypothetical protein
MVTNIDNVDFTQKPYSSEHKQKGREINKNYNVQSIAPTKTYKLEKTIGRNTEGYINKNYNVQSIAPTKTYKLEKTIGQTMKDYIKERIPLYVSSQKTNGGLHYNVEYGDNMNISAVHEGVLKGHYSTQRGNPMYQYNNNIDTKRYTQETFVNPVITTKTSEISNIIDDFEGDYIQVKSEIPNISVSGIKSSNSNNPNQHNYQNSLNYTRNVPEHSVFTNTKGNGAIDNTSRQYNRLPERSSRGSFMNNGNIPSTHKDTKIMLRNTSKQQLLNKMKTLR